VQLADFSDPAEANRWHSIDDVVMGGQSHSAMLAGERSGVFAGTVSLARGGGFASVRRSEQRLDLSSCSVIEIRLRGDGKRYKLNLRVAGEYDGLVYQAPFETEADTWQTARLPFHAFTPRFRGRPVEGTLDRRRVSSVGLLISDHQEGAFRLELLSIIATAAPLP